MAVRNGRAAAALGLAVLLGLGGCSDTRPPAPDTANPLALAQPARNTAAKLAYTHDLTIGLPPDRVAAHFAAARDRCLTDAGLGCILVTSSIDDGPRPQGRPQAQIQVRLPHESVAPYVAFLTAPLPGEAAGDVVLRRQATRADDLTTPIADGGRRLAQLAAYRARLDELSAKADTRVEDLIRIAQELSKVQSEIEEGEAKQRGLQRRVDTEIVSVSLRSDSARAGAFAPVEEAWSQAGQTFGASAGAALRFAVASLPWLPVAAIGLFLVRALWRLRRRKRARIGRPLTEARL
ncbi:hypothetical protein ASG60_05305 [Methylobacterium sp. Leaf469]|uniref:DUF4349 domain-containing protein n=1 Tax=Methylobacterium sp. Leaf469 TaxID=1736387 RepID=UPI0006F49758|nr:DUF4349 domain-containing protein [Methylobacterium sp. Leaf469]KQT99256.1 hypothetical protein ASG60_05305 [Methylobacterium sp. Leaf469]